MQKSNVKEGRSNLFHLVERNALSPQTSFNFTNSTSAHLVSKIRLLDILGFSKSQPRNVPFYARRDENGVGCLFCLKLSEDGSRIATSVGETVNIYNAHTGKLMNSLSSHTEIVTAFSWLHPSLSTSSADVSHSNSTKENSLENSFLTASLDKTIKWWINNQVSVTLKDHKGF